MISFDFECKNKHRFEGTFKNHEAYEDQLNKKMVQCPLCETDDIKRIYRGCSIQPKKNSSFTVSKEQPNLFETLKKISSFIKENSEYVGDNFSDRARAIHFGIEEEKNIYGESTPGEIKELIDEGIKIMPLVDIDKKNN